MANNERISSMPSKCVMNTSLEYQNDKNAIAKHRKNKTKIIICSIHCHAFKIITWNCRFSCVANFHMLFLASPDQSIDGLSVSFALNVCQCCKANSNYYRPF